MLTLLSLPVIALGLYGGTTAILHTQTDFCSDWGEFMNLVDTLDAGTEWTDLQESDLEADPSLIECGLRQLPHYMYIAGGAALESTLDFSPRTAEDEITD